MRSHADLCWPAHWKMHESTMKTCGHVSSRDKTPQQFCHAGAGLKNNEFCLRGLVETAWNENSAV